MATYLQGVTDYIPEYQPFQPDLNFYSNVLQTKQTQYDTNWKALNKMYGQYYNADLTRDENVSKKDNYLKQIEFNLQRVSQLDLSLEQNVNQATQVFKPFYEDKGLVKDMAWTKNFMNQVGRAEGLKGSNVVAEREQYWNDGVLAMNYKRDEFKEASSEDALSFENASYTPYVNTVAKAQEVAKAAGLSVESVDFSKDGKWIIKSKNGEQLTEPLQRLFEARLGNDPAIQEVYKTQAYVNRKNDAFANAAQFGGDKNMAELKYLEKSFNVLKAQSLQRYNSLKESSTGYTDKIADLQKQIKNGEASPDIQKQIDQYTMNKQLVDDVLTRSEQEQKELSPGEFTATTSTGFTNPYGDIKSLRYKVDNGMASLLMQKDLDEAANIFAFKDAKQDIDANPYAVMAEKHRYNMQAVAARNAGLANAAKIRNAGEKENALLKLKIESGAYYQNEETGEVIPVEALNEMYVDPNDKGTATDKLNLKTASRHINKLQTESIAKPFLQNTLSLIERMVDQGQMTRKEASGILAYGKNPGIGYDVFSKKLNKYGSEFLRSEVGSKDLAGIQKKMSTWLSQNGELSGLSGEEYSNYEKSALKFQDYTNYLKIDSDWRKTTSYEVERDLRRQGYKGADYLYDNKGNLRTEKEYYNALGYNSGDYEDLRESAGKVYSSTRIKKAPPGFAQLGEMTGSGKFSPGITSTWVNPRVHGSKSKVWANEVFRDLNKMDFGANDKNRVTFGGISKTSFDRSGESSTRNNVGKTLFDLMKGELTNPKSKMGNFRVGVAPVATGKLNKSAIIIHPDEEWLKQFVKTSTKTNPGTGLISQGEYNMILKNGISYITDANTMTNSMYKSSFQSPLSTYVDNKGSYTYTDPANENYKFTIRKNKLGAGDYTVELSMPLWNPETNEYIYPKVIDNTTNYGNNLELNRDTAIEEMRQRKEVNKLLYNGNY